MAYHWGIILGMICLGSVIAFIALGSKTKQVTASVSDIRWQLSIEILAQQPVQRSAWEEYVPVEAQDVSCRDEYKETSSFPAPKATEVCAHLMSSIRAAVRARWSRIANISFTTVIVLTWWKS